jgi:hypothetical protein
VHIFSLFRFNSFPQLFFLKKIHTFDTMGEEAPMSIPVDDIDVTPDVAKRSESLARSQDTAQGSESPGIEDRPLSPRKFKIPISTVPTAVDVTDYFVGPRNLEKHSKWPVFMQMQGSILPEMVLPLVFVACWSTLITCISHFVVNRKQSQPIAVQNGHSC